MKRLLFLCMALTLAPSLVVAGGVRLRYGFAPGQKWECTQKTQMNFENIGLGTPGVERRKYTILYTVGKGPKKNWVRLTAQYINPPPRTTENQFTLGRYDLIFSADMHTSGNIRNIQVQGVDKVSNDPSFPSQHKNVFVQNKKEEAQRLQPEVFWFPKLPEEPLEPGDQFEEKHTHGIKDSNMTEQSKTRTVFTLYDVSNGLASFETKTRHTSKVKTPGGNMDYGSSGKGELIFDLQKGMWIKFVKKWKTKYPGRMVGQDGKDWEMFSLKKITMEQN